MICPVCHAEIEDGSLFCTACGARIETAEGPARGAACPRCGAELAAGAQFCSQCGASVAPAGPVDDDGAQEAMAAMWGDGTAAPTRQSAVCPSCGAPVAPTDPYCPACGVRLARTAPGAGSAAFPQATQAAAASPAYPDARVRSGSTGPMPRVPVEPATAAPAAAVPSASRGIARTAGIALGVVAAVGLVAGGVWYVVDAQRQQAEAVQQAQEASQALHSVTVAASAEGWDTAAGASRLPVHIVGTNSVGEQVDEIQYVATDGTGIALRQGTYRLSVAGSPIVADGTIYTVDDVTIDLTIDTDDPAASIDATAAGAFTLTAIPALEVTDDQILAAYDLARGDTGEGAPSAEALRDAAIERRDDAAEAQREQEEQQAYNARHVVADSYEFYMPSYWDGRVTVQTDGDHVSVRSSKYPDLEVFNVTVQDGPTQAMGDIGYACLGDVALGDGRYATVWAYRWAWIIASANLRGSTDPDDYYTMDEANEIVDLQMGGNVDYESVLEEMTIRDGESDLVFVADDYLYACIVESLTGK